MSLARCPPRSTGQYKAISNQTLDYGLVAPSIPPSTLPARGSQTLGETTKQHRRRYLLETFSRYITVGLSHVKAVSLVCDLVTVFYNRTSLYYAVPCAIHCKNDNAPITQLQSIAGQNSHFPSIPSRRW